MNRSELLRVSQRKHRVGSASSQRTAAGSTSTSTMSSQQRSKVKADGNARQQHQRSTAALAGDELLEMAPGTSPSMKLLRKTKNDDNNKSPVHSHRILPSEGTHLQSQSVDGPTTTKKESNMIEMDDCLDTMKRIIKKKSPTRRGSSDNMPNRTRAAGPSTSFGQPPAARPTVARSASSLETLASLRQHQRKETMGNKKQSMSFNNKAKASTPTPQRSTGDLFMLESEPSTPQPTVGPSKLFSERDGKSRRRAMPQPTHLSLDAVDAVQSSMLSSSSPHSTLLSPPTGTGVNIGGLNTDRGATPHSTPASTSMATASRARTPAAASPLFAPSTPLKSPSLGGPPAASLRRASRQLQLQQQDDAPHVANDPLLLRAAQSGKKEPKPKPLSVRDIQRSAPVTASEVLSDVRRERLATNEKKKVQAAQRKTDLRTTGEMSNKKDATLVADDVEYWQNVNKDRLGEASYAMRSFVSAEATSSRMLGREQRELESEAVDVAHRSIGVDEDLMDNKWSASYDGTSEELAASDCGMQSQSDHKSWRFPSNSTESATFVGKHKSTAQRLAEAFAEMPLEQEVLLAAVLGLPWQTIVNRHHVNKVPPSDSLAQQQARCLDDPYEDWPQQLFLYRNPPDDEEEEEEEEDDETLERLFSGDDSASTFSSSNDEESSASTGSSMDGFGIPAEEVVLRPGEFPPRHHHHHRDSDNDMPLSRREMKRLRQEERKAQRRREREEQAAAHLHNLQATMSNYPSAAADSSSPTAGTLLNSSYESIGSGINQSPLLLKHSGSSAHFPDEALHSIDREKEEVFGKQILALEAHQRETATMSMRKKKDRPSSSKSASRRSPSPPLPLMLGAEDAAPTDDTRTTTPFPMPAALGVRDSSSEQLGSGRCHDTEEEATFMTQGSRSISPLSEHSGGEARNVRSEATLPHKKQRRMRLLAKGVGGIPRYHLDLLLKRMRSVADALSAQQKAQAERDLQEELAQEEKEATPSSGDSCTAAAMNDKQNALDLARSIVAAVEAATGDVGDDGGAELAPSLEPLTPAKDAESRSNADVVLLRDVLLMNTLQKRHDFHAKAEAERRQIAAAAMKRLAGSDIISALSSARTSRDGGGDNTSTANGGDEEAVPDGLWAFDPSMPPPAAAGGFASHTYQLSEQVVKRFLNKKLPVDIDTEEDFYYSAGLIEMMKDRNTAAKKKAQKEKMFKKKAADDHKQAQRRRAQQELKSQREYVRRTLFEGEGPLGTLLSKADAAMIKKRTEQQRKAQEEQQALLRSVKSGCRLKRKSSSVVVVDNPSTQQAADAELERQHSLLMSSSTKKKSFSKAGSESAAMNNKEATNESVIGNVLLQAALGDRLHSPFSVPDGKGGVAPNAVTHQQTKTATAAGGIGGCKLETPQRFKKTEARDTSKKSHLDPLYKLVSMKPLSAVGVALGAENGTADSDDFGLASVRSDTLAGSHSLSNATSWTPPTSLAPIASDSQGALGESLSSSTTTAPNKLPPSTSTSPMLRSFSEFPNEDGKPPTATSMMLPPVLIGAMKDQQDELSFLSSMNLNASGKANDVVNGSGNGTAPPTPKDASPSLPATSSKPHNAEKGSRSSQQQEQASPIKRSTSTAFLAPSNSGVAVGSNAAAKMKQLQRKLDGAKLTTTKERKRLGERWLDISFFNSKTRDVDEPAMEIIPILSNLEQEVQEETDDFLDMLDNFGDQPNDGHKQNDGSLVAVDASSPATSGIDAAMASVSPTTPGLLGEASPTIGGFESFAAPSSPGGPTTTNLLGCDETMDIIVQAASPSSIRSPASNPDASAVSSPTSGKERPSGGPTGGAGGSVRFSPSTTTPITKQSPNASPRDHSSAKNSARLSRRGSGLLSASTKQSKRSSSPTTWREALTSPRDGMNSPFADAPLTDSQQQKVSPHVSPRDRRGSPRDSRGSPREPSQGLMARQPSGTFAKAISRSAALSTSGSSAGSTTANVRDVDQDTLKKIMASKLRVAILIAISKYDDPRIVDDEQCMTDTLELEEILKTIGFKTTILHQRHADVTMHPSKENILNAIAKHTAKVKNEDCMAIVYFNGGGYIGPWSTTHSVGEKTRGKSPQSRKKSVGVGGSSAAPAPMVFAACPPEASLSGITAATTLSLEELSACGNEKGPKNIVIMDTYSVNGMSPCNTELGGFAKVGGRKSIGCDLTCEYTSKQRLLLSFYLKRALRGWATRDSRITTNSMNCYMKDKLEGFGAKVQSNCSNFFIGDLDLATVRELNFNRHEIKNVKELTHKNFAKFSMTVIPQRNQDPASHEFVREVQEKFIKSLKKEVASPLLLCYSRVFHDRLHFFMRSSKPEKLLLDQQAYDGHSKRAALFFGREADDTSVQYKLICRNRNTPCGVLHIPNKFSQEMLMYQFTHQKVAAVASAAKQRAEESEVSHPRGRRSSSSTMITKEVTASQAARVNSPTVPSPSSSATTRRPGYFGDIIQAKFEIDRHAVHEIGVEMTLSFLTTEYLARKMDRALRIGTMHKDFCVKGLQVTVLDRAGMIAEQAASKIQSIFRGNRLRQSFYPIVCLMSDEKEARQTLEEENDALVRELQQEHFTGRQQLLMGFQAECHESLLEWEYDEIRMFYRKCILNWQKVETAMRTKRIASLTPLEELHRAELLARLALESAALSYMVFARGNLQLSYAENIQRRTIVADQHHTRHHLTTKESVDRKNASYKF